MPDLANLFYRTEDLRLDEVLDYYVESPGDAAVVEQLKSRSPIVLRGSRGVGKSFLLRVAEAGLKEQFDSDRVLPVYVTFSRAGLLRQTASGFIPWMIARISTAVKRSVTSYGLALSDDAALVELTRGHRRGSGPLDQLVVDQLEQFWTSPDDESASRALPDADELREALDDLCAELALRRIVLFIDEAAHVFIPEQQRQFFTLMRDLRSPFISVKAAVYPGATSYGESFQPSHDATVLDVERSVTDPSYSESMRAIVTKQHPDGVRALNQYGEAFDVLASSAMGNPRVLLKTYAAALPFNRSRAQESMRNYYREEIWSEHSNLAERYPGHRELIDWGRNFLERDVLPALHSRNQAASETSSAIWIHRDAPQSVREALSLLCYSGILLEGVSGIRATRSELGTRYLVNLGCGFAQDGEPVAYGAIVRRSLSVKRMQEFGANHSAYRPIAQLSLTDYAEGNVALEARLKEDLSVLDLTSFQKSKLRELELKTIGAVLSASEELFQTLHYVGPVRARQMRNSAITAVIEYLSG